MEYWRGHMDWPLDEDWMCETCGEYHGLEWGMAHAQCRCNQCHTQYSMRADDEKRTVLTKPRCMVMEEYKEPLKRIWQELHIPVNEITKEQLEPYMSKVT